MGSALNEGERVLTAPSHNQKALYVHQNTAFWSVSSNFRAENKKVFISPAEEN